MVAPSLFGMLAVSLDLDLVFSTNIHMILDTQGELQTLYFSLSTIFANVRWKLVESCPPVLDTYHRHLCLTIVVLSQALETPVLLCCAGEQRRLYDEN